MGWDVFISHASEDKAAVAVPLKAALESIGISVWIDLEQIKLGDSFRPAIDVGLDRCRFGLVILSPRFFRKPWATAELDAVINLEMSASGVKRLLPVTYDLTFDDLRARSPLNRRQRAVRWEDGITAVVEAIAQVTGERPPHAPLPSVTPLPHEFTPAGLDTLVMFLFKDGGMAYLESVEIESGPDGMEMILKCDDAADAAVVQTLSRTPSDRIVITFGTTAVVGRVLDARLKRTGAKQVGAIKIKSEQITQNPMEFSFGGYSADQIAEMRARRVY